MKRHFLTIAATVCLGAAGSVFGQIAGKVTLTGPLPEMPEIKGMSAIPSCAAMHKDPVFEDTIVAGDNGELANVIVFIKEDKPGDLKGPRIEKPAVIDQKGCMYQPHVLAVQVGQPVIAQNSDPFLHNVHSNATANKPCNIVQVTVGPTKLEPFTKEETIQIKCDVHPWMKAVIRVFDHPYFATTGIDGNYSMDTRGLKDGRYVVRAWHEVYKDSEPQTIEVKSGKATKPVDFTFKAGAKTATTP